MFDQPYRQNGRGGEDEPIWDPSGWTPVFVDAEPSQRGAQLVGHTRLQMEGVHVRGERVRKRALSSPGDERVPPGSFLMHGFIVMHPYRQDGRLIWAWHLEDGKALPHVPDFRPL